MWARVSTIQGSADRFDQAVASLNDDIIPRAKGMSGFTGATFLGDRQSGKLIGITLWADEESLRASEETAKQLRDDAAGQAGGTIASVERFEVIAQV